MKNCNDEFIYMVPKGKDNEWSPPKKSRRTKIRVSIADDGTVDIIGNSEGLLYLARNLLGTALSKKTAGFHFHLEKCWKALDPDSLDVNIYNTDFGF